MQNCILPRQAGTCLRPGPCYCWLRIMLLHCIVYLTHTFLLAPLLPLPYSWREVGRGIHQILPAVPIRHSVQVGWRCCWVAD